VHDGKQITISPLVLVQQIWQASHSTIKLIVPKLPHISANMTTSLEEQTVDAHKRMSVSSPNRLQKTRFEQTIKQIEPLPYIHHHNSNELVCAMLGLA
jgi:hypothetical protein